HQAKTEEQERQAAQTVLNPDHFVVGGKNVFSPKSELVMLVRRVVRVWVVMRLNRCRSVHFRKKLQGLILKEKHSLQCEKFQIPPTKRWMASGLPCARFSCARRGQSASDHSPGHGLLLRGDRSP